MSLLLRLLLRLLLTLLLGLLLQGMLLELSNVLQPQGNVLLLLSLDLFVSIPTMLPRSLTFIGSILRIKHLMMNTIASQARKAANVQRVDVDSRHRIASLTCTRAPTLFRSCAMATPPRLHPTSILSPTQNTELRP